MISQCQPKDWGEDNFFAFCGWDKDVDFKVPSPRLAAKFSAQTDYVKGLRDISSRGMPFGCHYWPVVNYHFWKPYIENNGYILSEDQLENSSNTLLDDYVRRLHYLIKRYRRKNLRNNVKLYCVCFPRGNYSIWGAGKFGKGCIELFVTVFTDCNINHVYDEHSYGIDIGNIKIERPDLCKIKNDDGLLIITTTRYQYQIRKKLLACGMEEDRNFISLANFYEKVYQTLKSR